MISDKDIPPNSECKNCKICCGIYTDYDKGGIYPAGQVWFEEWCDDFHRDSDQYGVEPLFDPLIVHMDSNSHMLDELISKGINPGACQYLSKDGCLIEYPKRPVHCRRYYCERGEFG